MKYKKILEKAKRESRLRKRYLSDRRAREVLGFLAAKGLLFTDGITPIKRTKISVKDALWVAQKIEPRVVEVLPAAIINFPGAFNDLDKLPETLSQIVFAIKKGRKLELSYLGIPFEKMAVWASVPLPDGRVKPVGEKKRLKSFRLHPEIISELSRKARAADMTQTEYLEKIIAAS
ncbi:MAG: hypothetical protein D6719_10645 [Candidatus Dadabacteria bacterium]|nr:MAG: hypothetical protein D6719_10645 [Candidatus Dadabacteria bacterium]